MAPLDIGRWRGALLGLAVGDAVGTTVEFKPPGTFPPVTDMVGGGPFNLPAGAWTDDTSMALCLAESLVECRGFDPVDQLRRYVRWYREGHWSSTGSCFDIGNATAAALQRFEQTGEPYPGDAAPAAGGNGPLMKLAPVVLAFARDPRAAVVHAGESARTTHGAPEAVDATCYLAALLTGALLGADKATLLAPGGYEPVAGLWEEQPLHPKLQAIVDGSYLHAEPPRIRGGGYALDALEAALWALRSTDSFEAGVLAAVNLGDDADTTGAIYGQLAGALYGVDAIPARWRERVLLRDEILRFADALFALAQPLPGDAVWVRPGRLLAGAYPGAPGKAEAQAKLDAFIRLGVTCFLDLTEETEPLHPYTGLRGSRARHVRLPIPDGGTPPTWLMRAILATLRAALEAGEVVYVHSRGGVGRVGTVIGCLLREDGVDVADVLGRLASDHQRRFVTGWAGALRSSDVPGEDADWEAVSAFAYTFDGYRHFGERWGEPYSRARAEFDATGKLPERLDDLRAVLFLAVRADYWDGGLQAEIPDPELRRALVRRIRELVRTG